MITSVTQLTTFQDCNRKWWFTWIKKLPEVDRGYFTFGTVLHAVCERYLGADMQGRDPQTGKPVDLYPEGWETTFQGKGKHKRQVSISLGEQDLVKKLIDTAIEQGYLVRQAGLTVEKKFQVPLVEELDIDILGFMDVADHEGVIDHKTVGNWRYAKSKKSITKDIQMLTYAGVWARMQMILGAPVPDNVKVQHNQFGKKIDDPKCRKIVGYVTKEQMESNWIHLQNLARQMPEVAAKEEYHEVEEPDPASGVCNKYGGCQFLDICGGRETVEKYQERVLRVNSRTIQSDSNDKPKRRSKMAGLFDKKLNERKEKALKNKEQEPKKEAPKKEEAPAETTGQAEAPPWAWDKCPACSGAGFNSKGNPCRICNSNAQKNGLPTSDQFVIESIEGEYVWEEKASGETGSKPSPQSEKTTKTKEEVADGPDTAPEESEAAPETPDESPEESEAASNKTEEKPKSNKSKPQAEKKKMGRPPKGFTLLVGCGISKGVILSQQVVFEEVFAEMGAELAEKHGVSSYYSLNAFDRRDWMAQGLSGMDFGTKHVIVRSEDPDIKHLLPVLRSMAGTVIE